MGGKGFEVLVRQLGHLDPDNPDAQWQAAIKLGELGDYRAVEPLIKALNPLNQALVRAHAAQAFWKLTDKKAIDPLIVALKDPYYLVRSYSARALGKLHNKDKEGKIVDPLIDALQNDAFFGARAEAAEALGSIASDANAVGREKADEALRKYRETVEKEKAKKQEKDKDERTWRVDREIERALKYLDETLKDIKKMAKSQDWSSDQLKFLGRIAGNLNKTRSLLIGARIGSTV